jgi:quercetin dioxygenase-like cupin family protein
MTTTRATAACIAALLLPVSATLRAQDAAAVNPSTVHVKLENERVRILEAEIPPGVKEQLHSHPACVVHVIAGGKARIHADGKSNEVELVAGTTTYREPTTHWSENIGKTTLRLMIVELK